MPKKPLEYEYKVINLMFKMTFKTLTKSAEDEINKMTKEGWKLVSQGYTLGGHPNSLTFRRKKR